MHGMLRPASFALAAVLAAGASARDGDAPPGKQVFTSAEPPCSICHVLEDAGATGKVGPSLDMLRPTPDQVRNALRDGPGAMPAYGERLSEEEMEALAEYVAQATGQEEPGGESASGQTGRP